MYTKYEEYTKYEDYLVRENVKVTGAEQIP